MSPTNILVSRRAMAKTSGDNLATLHHHRETTWGTVPAQRKLTNYLMVLEGPQQSFPVLRNTEGYGVRDCPTRAGQRRPGRGFTPSLHSLNERKKERKRERERDRGEVRRRRRRRDRGAFLSYKYRLLITMVANRVEAGKVDMEYGYVEVGSLWVKTQGKDQHRMT